MVSVVRVQLLVRTHCPSSMQRNAGPLSLSSSLANLGIGMGPEPGSSPGQACRKSCHVIGPIKRFLSRSLRVQLRTASAASVS